ncbi:hypothetical protein LCGC14_1569800 [marine sediment metagenome]|uniref:Uncharacterized protein n=1 Tax=marine sediment metagenome TaxID=412755 RepID=A0A0F9L136_9ZZZZ|nr:hypothetical protein [bacterium]
MEHEGKIALAITIVVLFTIWWFWNDYTQGIQADALEEYYSYDTCYRKGIMWEKEYGEEYIAINKIYKEECGITIFGDEFPSREQKEKIFKEWDCDYLREYVLDRGAYWRSTEHVVSWKCGNLPDGYYPRWYQ